MKKSCAVVLILALLSQFTTGIQTEEEHSGVPLAEFTDSTTHDATGHDANNTSHHGEHEDGHHGIQLASWKWDEYSDHIIICLMILMAGIVKIGFHETPLLSKHLPESCVLILLGIVVGIFVYYGVESHSHHFPRFTKTLFFNVLLPPIILDAAYSLYDRDFLANLGSVIQFAVIGTLFNVFLIGYGLYALNKLNVLGTFPGELTAIQCLVFSSLISAVDPVAVLAIFDEIGVNKGLYFLVFGESLFNDGVTVVLYNTMVSLSTSENVDAVQYVLAFFSFFFVVFGGLFIGVVVGMLSALILKYTQHTRVVEPLIVFISSYFAFILAETIHWSGIISLIGCGICQKRYAFPNISKKSYTTVKYSVKTLSAFSDCIIFLFLGIVTISKTHAWQYQFAIWTIILCTVVRFLGVGILSWLLNQRRIKNISIREQFIMAYGGLRGAVGFSLVTILKDDNHLKNIFQTTTLIMIFFTVFIQGGTIKHLVSWLNIQRKQKQVKMISTDVNEKTIDHLMAGVESVVGTLSKYTMLEFIRKFDNTYIKKLLIRSDAEDMLALRLQRISLDEHYARLYGPTVMVAQKKVGAVLKPAVTPEESKLQEEDKLKQRKARLGRLSLVSPAKGPLDKERETLRHAFSDNPFERYNSRDYRMDSPEHIESKLKDHYEKRTKALWQIALTVASVEKDEEGQQPPTAGSTEMIEMTETRPPKVGQEEEGATMLGKTDQGPQSPPPPEVGTPMADRIRRAYRRSKREFKHNQ